MLFIYQEKHKRRGQNLVDEVYVDGSMQPGGSFFSWSGLAPQ